MIWYAGFVVFAGILGLVLGSSPLLVVSGCLVAYTSFIVGAVDTNDRRDRKEREEVARDLADIGDYRDVAVGELARALCNTSTMCAGDPVDPTYIPPDNRPCDWHRSMADKAYSDILA